jgi:hypothetical protein
VQVEVKDKALAEEALKKLGLKGTITQNADKKHWTVVPENPPYNFTDKFNEEYGVLVATKKARAENYTVTRVEENGQTVLYMRQY